MKSTLIDTAYPINENTLLRNTILVLGGSLLIWLSAKIHIPFWPVPMTMQTFAVLVIAMTFGWKLGGATVLCYLVEGALGLPVFSGTPEKGIGIAYMMGTTGGYLFGFLLSAILCGWLAEKGWDRSFPKTIIAMFLGTTVIFIFGLLWLGTVLGWDKPILEYGFYPFVLGAILKIILAALTLPLAWKILKK